MLTCVHPQKALTCQEAAQPGCYLCITRGGGGGKWGDVRNLRAERVSITWVKDEAPHVCTCVPWIVHYIEARLGVELNTFYVYVW